MKGNIKFPKPVIDLFKNEEEEMKQYQENIFTRRSARAEVYLSLEGIPREEWNKYQFKPDFSGMELIPTEVKPEEGGKENNVPSDGKQ